MAGRITSVEPQQHSTERVNVFLDGEFAFGLALIESAHLRVGEWLSDAELARLQQADTLERAKQKLLELLSYRPRSEAELRRALSERDFPEPVIEEALESLRRVELVDDRAFVAFWVENRTQFRPRGRRALNQELREKGIPTPLIEEALADFDETAAGWAVAEQQARRLSHLPPEQFRKRLSDRLARRGFSFDFIREALVKYSSPSFILEESENLER